MNFVPMVAVVDTRRYYNNWNPADCHFVGSRTTCLVRYFACLLIFLSFVRGILLPVENLLIL